MATQLKLEFHTNHGKNVQVSGNNRTGERDGALYNQGVLFTNRVLQPGELFQFRIDKRANKWQGNLQFGVTTESPDNLKCPDTMSKLIGGGTGQVTILWDGEYVETPDDRERSYSVGSKGGALPFDNGGILGLKCTSRGELHYYVNGQDIGIAAKDVPRGLRGVIDLQADICKVTIVDSKKGVLYPVMKTMDDAKLVFHPRTAANAEMLNNCQTAVRRPNAYNKGIVMSSRKLKDGELFEMSIDKTQDQWTGCIAIGVTQHDPGNIAFPNTVTDMHDTTWILSGPVFSANGCVEEEQYAGDLDRLTRGDLVGVKVMKGSLHFFINGKDKGALGQNIPNGVYVIVDMYGAASQVSVVQGTGTDKGAQAAASSHASPTASGYDLFFHPHCGTHVSVLNKIRAKRNASTFNQGVVLSNRTLEPNEIFEVNIEEENWSWSGSIEIGVTTLDPNTQCELPSTMSIMEDDSWMLVGESIIHHAKAIREGYAQGVVQQLTKGNRIGVQVTDRRELHFFINGHDMGCAATGMPADVFGAVDMYGRTTQISVNPTTKGAKAAASVVNKLTTTPITSASFQTTEGIQVTIKTGNLVDEKVEVIVNTIGKNMVLDAGIISKVILKAAGNSIQQEVTKNAPKGTKFSQVIESSGGKMRHLKAIYHGSIAGYDGGKGEATLAKFLENIYDLAHTNGIKSVAIPAIGTGTLRYPADIVAEIIVDQVTNFSRKHGQSTTLKDIRVILYAGDATVIEGFERFMTGYSDTESTSDDFEAISFAPPPHWSPMRRSEQCQLITLAKDSDEYTNVAIPFTETGGPSNIVRIERVQSPNMYMIYSAYKVGINARFDKRTYKLSERILYHGTKSDSIDSINKNGFNRSYCGQNATRFGYGVYFAVNASYSAARAYSPPDDKGIRHIYQCRVLSGEYTEGKSNYKAPPPKDPNSPNILYHSVVDDMHNPMMFVTFHDASAIPEYVISFK